MICSYHLHLNSVPCLRTVEGVALYPISSALRSLKCMVEVDTVPERRAGSKNRAASHLRVAFYFWDTSQQCYLSEIVISPQQVWDRFFLEEVTYTRDPEAFIRADQKCHIRPEHTVHQLETQFQLS